MSKNNINHFPLFWFPRLHLYMLSIYWLATENKNEDKLTDLSEEVFPLPLPHSRTPTVSLVEIKI